MASPRPAGRRGTWLGTPRTPVAGEARDYDCQGGPGNGPRYVDGPIRVRPPDRFGLDSDGDGLGCE
jgi:hypothetical protein